MKDFLLVIDHTGNPNSAVATSTEEFDIEEDAKNRLIELVKKGTTAFVYAKTYAAAVTVEIKPYKKDEAIKPESDETAGTIIP